jgi:hypothetical protein
MPVAIHSEPVSEKTRRPRHSRHDGLPRPSLTLTPRNDKQCVFNEMGKNANRKLHFFTHLNLTNFIDN